MSIPAYYAHERQWKVEDPSPGHARKGTHSIYQDNFPFHVRDDACRQIIDLDLKD